MFLWVAFSSMVSCGGEREEREREARAKKGKPAAKETERISRTPEGDPVIRLEPATQIRIGLRTHVLTLRTMESEVVAYGRLEEDPSQSFTVRASIAGTLHFAPGRNWPGIGQHLADNSVFGLIEPRLAPAERIALTSQLETARSDLSAGTASLTAARAAYDRARILNSDDKNVSDRVLEEAAARLKTEEARAIAAADTVRLLQSSLTSAGLTGNKPLLAERGGDVVDIAAHPGESIEPGSPILRVARLDRLLARVDVPVGQRVPPSVSKAQIVPLGYEDQPVPAERAGLAATVDAKAQGESFLFRLNGTRFGLRPGLAVTARIGVPGPIKRGVVIPRSALVRVAGKSYAWVRIGSRDFVRREISLEDPVGDGYFTTTNFSAGDPVVVDGAQILLSEEFKVQTAIEEE